MQALLSQACKQQPGPGEAVAGGALGARSARLRRCPSLARPGQAGAGLPAPSLGGSMRLDAILQHPGVGFGGGCLVGRAGCRAPAMHQRGGGKNLGLQHLGQLQLPNKRQSRGSLHAAPGQRRRVSKVGLPGRPGSLLGLILPHLSDAATLPLLAPSAKPGAACVIRPFIPPD